MVDQLAIRTALGVVGNVISFGLFLSPALTFWRIIKAKNVEEYDWTPYWATMLNCMCWIFYGTPWVSKNNTLVWTINAVGLVIEFIYVGIYLRYGPEKLRKVLYLVLEVIFVVVLALAVILAIRKDEMALNRMKRTVVVGVVCDVFNIIMYASPLFIVKKVITTKSVEYMPFLLSLTGFLNALCWTTYALLHEIDYFVLISNGIGVICGAIQLIVYAIYYKDTRKSKPPKEVELPRAADNV